MYKQALLKTLLQNCIYKKADVMDYSPYIGTGLGLIGGLARYRGLKRRLRNPSLLMNLGVGGLLGYGGGKLLQYGLNKGPKMLNGKPSPIDGPLAGTPLPPTYTPHPLDLSGIELPPELQNDLGERIAENVHDQWAQSRIGQGWVYGPERNDKLKQTPCLVPYGDLPDVEKQYDRDTAMSTLKLIKALGYDITKQQSGV